MMQKILIILSLSFLLVACESANFLKNAPRCPPPPEFDKCNPGAPTVTLHLNNMKATPPNLCVKAGDTVEMQITPAPDKVGTVVVVAKDFFDTWLIGTNSPDKSKISITIPDWVSDGDYNYGFLTNNGKCADPRFRVE